MTQAADDSILDPTDRALRDLLATGLRERDAADRRRRGSLRRQAQELATLHGTLASLAEEALACTVRSVSGEHTGWVTGLGRDHVRLSCGAGADVLVALPAIGTVRTRRPAGFQVQEPTAREDGELADALRLQVHHRPAVRVVLADGSVAEGRLGAVGQDLLVLDAPGGGAVHVRLGAVAEVWWPGEGTQSSASPLSPAPTTSG